jgi:hypothetical protein
MAECSSGNVSLEDVKNCRICKKTLQHPIRLQCIHSYCKVCLENTTKVETGGKVGWHCPTCGMFSDQNETKEDTLLEKLIAIEEGKGNVQQEALICEFCEKERPELLYCKDCRMVICGKCKCMHIKAPATKHHDIGNISESTGVKEDVIDEVVFCSKHNKHIVETFCETCNDLLCKVCLKDHYQHSLKTIEQSLSRLVVDMNECMKNITTKLATTKKQIEAIDEEILNLHETYAKWRIDSDTKLDLLKYRLKATKALLDEQVNYEESKNVELLKEIKTKVQNQRERLKIVSLVANLTEVKTQQLSQMKELQSGLLKQAIELKQLEIHVENLQITTPYIDEKLYDYTEDEILQLLRPVKYVNTNKVIDQSGIKIGKNLVQHMFEDLNEYLAQKFNQVTTITLPNYSYRLNAIGDSLYIGLFNNNTIQQYNTAGQCVKTFNNTHQTLVVKQATNGDIITGGQEGLFVTNKEFNNWLLLQNGSFADIVIHGNKFTAIDIKQYKVLMVT